MPYYQDIVAEYLREDRAVFTNTECLIELTPGTPGPYWYCDVMAVDFRSKAVYLCEVSYARNLAALVRRLGEWNMHWPAVTASVRRDSRIPQDWPITPWLFIPGAFEAMARAKLNAFLSSPAATNAMPQPRIFALEEIVPWKDGRNKLLRPSEPDQMKASVDEPATS